MTPSSNSILEQAAQRAMDTTEAKALEAEAVASVRQAIGRATYDTAKKVLPLIEQSIRDEYQPFLAQATAIMQMAATPAPQALSRLLQAISAACEACPRTLREGMAAYDRLSFTDLAWTDGRTIDTNKRTAAIESIRAKLTNHDGMLSFLKSQKSQAEGIFQSWPR